MDGSKADIIARLRKDILYLQGLKHSRGTVPSPLGLGPIMEAFPNAEFPLGAVHEFISANPEESTASLGFITAMLSKLMEKGGVALWIRSSTPVFPPGLAAFGVEPDHIIFIDLKKDAEIAWVVEEGLKCEGIAGVVGEMRDLDFITSRRLQLAVEKSRVTGFIVRRQPRQLNATACVTRWRVQPVSTAFDNDMPGIAYPRWKVELLKVRNGKPGCWQLEWAAGNFHYLREITEKEAWQQKKTG